jgi:hypothetical protein
MWRILTEIESGGDAAVEYAHIAGRILQKFESLKEDWEISEDGQIKKFPATRTAARILKKHRQKVRVMAANYTQAFNQFDKSMRWDDNYNAALKAGILPLNKDGKSCSRDAYQKGVRREEARRKESEKKVLSFKEMAELVREFHGLGFL